MSSLQSVRGTHDLLPDTYAKYNTIIQVAREVSQRFGYQDIATPIFEFSEVFKRTLGQASDIVNKEMYTFTDRSGDELTLRPEGTAGIARCFISEGLTQNLPLKLFYQGPMFRYERPQKGRQRQFHQLGVELLGVPTALGDLEVLSLATEVLRELKVLDRSRLEINSIGDPESRANYILSLKAYLEPYVAQLSPDSQKRLQVNPLRILDSKDGGDQALLVNAPRIHEFYNEASREVFRSITDGLERLGITYVVNPGLVRGLDYYSHCVFEFKTQDLGAQDTILSGGRYDQLISQMGGPNTPGVGFAAGIERLALLSPLKARVSRPLAVIPVHASVEMECFQIANQLRLSGLHVEMAFSGNLSKRMKRAVNQGAWGALIVGPDELAQGQLQVKLLDATAEGAPAEQKVMVQAGPGLAEALLALRP